MVHEQILTLLTGAGVPFEIHRHVPVTTLAQARERVPHLCRNLLKTVVFGLQDAGWVLAALEGEGRIHYKRLAGALGRRRTELRSVAPANVERELGFPIGGVGPFPIRDDVTVVLDQRVAGLDFVLCGSGRSDCTLELRAGDLIVVSRALVHPIGRD
jgi:Cys-tRNA(Pro)/Cys-tRNA(Cys) deacylase